MNENDAKKGVDPRHFLFGGMVGEEATSAFLATLIDQSHEFWQRFLRLCGIPQFSVTEVGVERDLRDVTVYGENAALIIENKIAGSSKQSGQLPAYYRRFKEEHPNHCVHSVYLAPTRELGRSEVEMVREISDEREHVVAIAWAELKRECEGLSDFDQLFAEHGIEHVLNLIQQRKSRARTEWAISDYAIRDVLACVAEQIAKQFPNRPLDPFGCRELWMYGPISIKAKCEIEVRDSEVNNDELEMRVCLMFRVANKHDDRHQALAKIAPLKAAGQWNDYHVDEQKNWMVKEFAAVGSKNSVADSILNEFATLAETIYGLLEVDS